LEIKSDLLLNASVPGTVDAGPDGVVRTFDSRLNFGHFIFNPINVGGAIDLGMNKVFESGWKISASILNIGVINWNKNIHQLYQKSAIKYTGSTSGINDWKDFTDTLSRAVNLKYAEGKSFLQKLTPEIMFGVSYPVVEYLRAGVTGYTAISSTGNTWAITATAFTDNISNIYGALSYTVTSNSFVNIGAGLGFRLGAFNLHALTDNIIAVFNPTSQKYATIQFGINFKFGCGEEGRSKKYSSVPCPSFGHSTGARNSVPCSSGKK
jgi:hypothetical protein